ncbi:hypothetical protein PG994_012267 [Apiospora phragmitis]|uniref:Neutral ceramidase n=1 Tax=Apiospora phragmitis TaxID=2905665 RepID=A0ABR1TVA4_9PEZI
MESPSHPRTPSRKNAILFTVVVLLPWIIPSGENHGTEGTGHLQDIPDSAQYAGTEEHEHGDEYLIGVGKADITGPCVEINLMGYADPNQIGTGLRQRLHSRAFIVADPQHPDERFIYLVLDTQSGDTAVRYGILSGLQELGSEYAGYGQHNIAVTGTHSHSGPGAWLNYLLPQITSKGFNHQSYRAIVDGAILSIRRAHESLAPGYLSVGSTKVFGANINRSLFAYLANPETERSQYNTSAEDDGSVEKGLTLLNFQRASDKKNIGVLTWFPTHGTSVYGNNTLISGDNKGVSATLFENSVKGDEDSAEGFVAGFSQASVGDTSPNVLGAWCEDGTGRMCSFENSTCSDGKSQKCHARGPLFTTDDTGAASCFEPAAQADSDPRSLGQVLSHLSRHVEPQVRAAKRHRGHHVSGGLGLSFAAGTSDGPGAFDFTQHDGGPNTTSPVWSVVSGLLKAPTEEQKACHHPKPILLDVGEVHKPYLWTPNVVDIQVFRVGQMVIVVSPGEATTMAGRRWKNAVAGEVEARSRRAESGPGPDPEAPVVVLGGPANSYTHYITTEEEYGIQRYEGASTLYGPHTLHAYINLTLSFVPYLDATSHQNPPLGPEPPNNVNRSLSFVPGVVYDSPGIFKSFGDTITDVPDVVQRGSEATAVFVGANPRNNLRLEQSYATVERLVVSDSDTSDDDTTTELRTKQREEEKKWLAVRDDNDWHLVFRWRRTSELLATSEVTITWETETETEPGVYRIRYFGDAKTLGGSITPFEGVSREFTVTA